MSLDPRRMKISQVVRLLNSTPAGTVTTDQKMRAHHSLAGFRIGDDKTIDLFRYAAWLWVERRRRMELPPSVPDYDTKKEQARRRSLEKVMAGQNIGELPPVKDETRRNLCRTDFRKFAELYLPVTFTLNWSADHLKAIAKIETAVLRGGLFALAMPRGSGKTCLAIAAAIWALLYGHREFVALIGATESKAAELLDSIRVELEHNERLLEDFPETCFPIRSLEGINQRRLRYQGTVIEMGFSTKRIELPLIPGTRAVGGIVRAAGITGAIRGMNFKRSDGRAVRPSLVIVDDPQPVRVPSPPPRMLNGSGSWPGTSWAWRGPARRFAGCCPVPSSARETWPTISSI